MSMSLFGGGSAKRAAKEQAAAIRAQTAATVRDSAVAAQAAADQMRNTLLNEQAATYARDLLSAPTETVRVRLAPSEIPAGNVTKRTTNVRDSYQTPSWFA